MNVTSDEILEALKEFKPSNINTFGYIGMNICSVSIDVDDTCANVVMIRIGKKFAMIIPGTYEYTVRPQPLPPAPATSLQQGVLASLPSANKENTLLAWSAGHLFVLTMLLWIYSQAKESWSVTALVGLLVIIGGILVFWVADQHNYEQMIDRVKKDSEFRGTVIVFFAFEILTTIIAALLSR